MIGFFILLAITASQAANVEFETGKWVQISKHRPGQMINDELIMNVPAGTNIYVVCDDIRFPIVSKEEECDYGRIVFNDGRNPETQVCGTPRRVISVTSKTGYMKVIVKTKEHGGFVSCKAKNDAWPKPERKELPLHEVVELEAKPVEGGFDKAWQLYSRLGQRISVQCELDVLRDDECSRDSLSVDLGDGNIQRFCGRSDETFFSISNTILIRMDVPENGGRLISCLAQAVTGPNPNQIDNEPSAEVDSSEHGVSPGSHTTTCNCGSANKKGSRIINGVETGEGEYPFMVALEDAGRFGYCGGSIITPKHVLTAAHCVTDKYTGKIKDTSDVNIAVGKHDRFKAAAHGKSAVYKSSQIMPHEKYQPPALTNDIAVVKTQEAMQFSKFVSPICLSPVALPVINHNIKLIGWGHTEAGYGSQVLLQTKGRVYPPAFCRRGNLFICVQSKNTSSCYGDSGGPLVWVDPETNRYTQVSLVSHGTKADCTEEYHVTTNVTHYYDWIQDKINLDGQNELCRKI